MVDRQEIQFISGVTQTQGSNDENVQNSVAESNTRNLHDFVSAVVGCNDRDYVSVVDCSGFCLNCGCFKW